MGCFQFPFSVVIPISNYYWCCLTRCGLVTLYGDIDLGQHCSGNGLLPDGTKPSPEPMLTYLQLSPVTFISGQFQKRYPSHQSLKLA